MPLLVNSVPNLAQGVSQQPDNLRYPGQCDEQINAWATVVEGLVKRPPTTYTKKIGATDPGANLFTHFVKRDETNKYCVTVSLGNSVSIGQVGVIDLDSGNNIPVTTTSIATSYLSGITNPLADLRALTVADYTFLVNNKKEVKVDTDPALLSKDIRDDNGKYNALVFVKLGDYEKTYDIYLEGKVVPHDGLTGSTPPGGHTYESGAAQGGGTQTGEHADTELIAEGLETVLNAYLGSDKILTGLSMSGGSGFTQSQKGGTNVFNPTDPLPIITRGVSVTYSFNLEQFEEDTASPGNPDLDQKIGFGAGGTLIIGSNGAVQSFQLTHEGTGYDATQTTPGVYDKPFVLTITKLTSVRKRTGSSIQTGRSNYSTETSKTVYTSFPSTPGVVMPTFTPSLPSSASYTVEREGAVIKIQADHDFSLRTEDGLANEGLGVAYKEVASITDLPKRCFNDFRVRVRGDADIDQDDYYVIFSTKDRENFGEGTWVETVGWDDGPEAKRASKGIDTTIDKTTMPIVLVADSYDAVTGKVDSFTLQTPNEYGNVVVKGGVYYNLVEDHISNSDTEPGTGADWQDYWVTTTAVSSAQSWRTNVQYFERGVGYGQRNAGDNATNPFPSFVGNTINDVFFFKNRLGFLTDSNVIFSEADEYFNFFRTTTQQLLDSAPIDVGLSHTKVAVLQHAVPFQEKLMLFSKQSQFVLRGAEILSPKTVAISPVTEYDISDSVQPVALGNYIYFTFRRNDFEGMYEYFVDNNTETFHSEEITSQIPKYITKQVEKIAGSQAENTIVVGTSGDRNTLFVYKYFWSNKEKIQSAWMKFTFGREVRGFDFIDSNLHLFTKDDDGLHLEKLTLEDGLKDAGLDYTLYLDSKVDGSELTVSSYNLVTKVTRVSGIPYDVSINTDATIYTKLGNERAFTVVDSSTVDVSGPLASYADYGGDYVTYNSEYYYCIKTHTSTGTFESNNWTKALHPPSGVIDAWQASTSYVQGTIYKCDTNHTSTAADTPDTSAKWSTTSEVSRAAEWGANVFYNNDAYFVLGLSYNMLYRFSDQTLKQPTERGGRSASDYAFQTIRNGSLNYAETGHFTVEVTPKFRDKYTYAFNPDIVGANLTLNAFTPQDGHFRFPVQCQPNEAKIEVVTDSALPVKLLAAEFESMMIPRSRRYGA